MSELSFDGAVERAATSVERADRGMQALKAAQALIKIVKRGGATLNGVPLEELVAAELKMPLPDRKFAMDTVLGLLEDAAEPLAIAEQAERTRRVRALELLPAGLISSDATLIGLPPTDQLH